MSMAAIATNPHRDRVEEDDESNISISRSVARGDGGYHTRRGTRHDDYGHWKR